MIVKYAPGRAGQKAKITTHPGGRRDVRQDQQPHHHVGRGQLDDASPRTGAYGANTITVRGRVPVGRSTGNWLITVDKPELYAGAVFRAELAKLEDQRRRADQDHRRHPPTSGRVVGSRHLDDAVGLLVPFMKLSNNMHAEALTKAMSRADGGSGTWKDGLAVTTSYLRRLGVPMAGVTLTDGSGLTRRNQADPAGAGDHAAEGAEGALVAAVLRVAAGRRQPPAAGRRHVAPPDGRHACARTTPAAKTGTLTGVTALSGYVTGRDGRTVRVLDDQQLHRRSTPRPVEDTFVIALAAAALTEAACGQLRASRLESHDRTSVEHMMSLPQRQPSSLFELQFPQSVGIYNSYADAQKAVDYLSDEKFEVQNLAIVGTELKSVERVLGRRNWGTVITQGLQSGISTGLLVGLVVLIFTKPTSYFVLLLVLARDRHHAGRRVQRCRLRDDPGQAGLHLGHPDRGDEVRGALRAQGGGPGPGAALADARRPRQRVRVVDRPSRARRRGQVRGLSLSKADTAALRQAQGTEAALPPTCKPGASRRRARRQGATATTASGCV